MYISSIELVPSNGEWKIVTNDYPGEREPYDFPFIGNAFYYESNKFSKSEALQLLKDRLSFEHLKRIAKLEESLAKLKLVTF